MSILLVKEMLLLMKLIGEIFLVPFWFIRDLIVLVVLYPLSYVLLKKKIIGRIVMVSSNECTLLCWWMIKKHEWLIPELKALNDYLFSVNNSLVRPAIKLRICYDDAMKLDTDLLDSVFEYLQEHDNNV